MRYTKQALPLAKQIEVLKQRGLIFDNEEEATHTLHFISYFRLAQYWSLMEADKETHQFRPNSHFEQAMNLYHFDNKLKTLVFNAIRQIEVALRTRIIHHFSMSFGAFWFMQEDLFSDSHRFEQHLKDLRKELKRSHDKFITDHFRRYTEPDMPPAWKTLEVASLGTLSKLYSNFTNRQTKINVAHDFGIPQHIYLSSWLKSLTIVRNVCAHHARLWNQRFPIIPKISDEISGDKWITQFNFLPNSLYPNLCCIAYWLNSIHPTNTFAFDLQALLTQYPTVDPAAMGFPQDWQNESLWK